MFSRDQTYGRGSRVKVDDVKQEGKLGHEEHDGGAFSSK